MYKWSMAYEALQRLQESEHDPCEGAILEYVNPVNGGHVMPTLGCYLQALQPGFHGQAHRHTSSTVYFVVRGSGKTIVDDQELAWEQNDIVAIPNWQWHEHVAGDQETVLFSFTDQPALEALDLYREEVRA